MTSEKNERVVLKLPGSLINYLRKEFPHGQRSEFIARCILRNKKQKEIKEMESKLKKAAKQRQI